MQVAGCRMLVLNLELLNLERLKILTLKWNFVSAYKLNNKAYNMKKSIKTIALLVLILSTHNMVYSQLSTDTLKAQFIKDWQRAKAYTQEYLDAMPADKYSFKAVDSIRSFAQQMLHLAQGTVFITSKALGKQPIFTTNLEASPSAATKDSVVYYVNASYDFVIDGLQKMSASKLTDKVGMMNFSEPAYVWLLKGFEHQTHHRGQTTIYIRLVGIRPPQEKLF